jgi:hypothetical protein
MPACPIDDTHNDTEESDLYLDDSDIKPNTIPILVMCPPAKVSTLVVVRPVSETVLGQSPAQHEHIEPAVTPPTASLGGHVPASRASRLRQLKAERLAQQAQWRLRKAQAGLVGFWHSQEAQGGIR